MHKIVTRRALDAARRRPQTVALDGVAYPEPIVDSDDAIHLYDALASLSPVQRAAVLLHYYAGMRSHEIAGAIGVLPSTVRFHLMSARRRVRAALRDYREATLASQEVISHPRLRPAFGRGRWGARSLRSPTVARMAVRLC